MSQRILALTTVAFACGDGTFSLIISTPSSFVTFPSCGILHNIDVGSALVAWSARKHTASPHTSWATVKRAGSVLFCPPIGSMSRHALHTTWALFGEGKQEVCVL